MSQICSLCDLPLIVEEDHNYFYKGEPVHRDCYYKELGEFIEENPIGYKPRRFL